MSLDALRPWGGCAEARDTQRKTRFSVARLHFDAEAKDIHAFPRFNPSIPINRCVFWFLTSRC